MEQPLFIGIDVSKAKLDVAILPTGELLEAPNDPDGHVRLVTRLQAEGSEARIVLEATGGYERECALALFAGGLPVAVVNPRPLRASLDTRTA